MRKPILLLLLLPLCILPPVHADEDDITSDSKEIRALRIALEELVTLLKRQNEQVEIRSLSDQVLAYDKGIVTLDRSMREVMKERAKVGEDLTAARSRLSGLRELIQNGENVGAAVDLVKEKVAKLEERDEHLTRRITELQETLRQRRVERQEFERSLSNALDRE